MNTLRVVLIIAGILFVLGLIVFQGPKLKLFHNIKSIPLSFLKNIFNSINAFFLGMKNNLARLFVADEPDVDETRRKKYHQDELSQDQLIAMSNLVANKRRMIADDSSEKLAISRTISPNRTKKASFNKETSRDISKESIADTKELLICLTVLPKPGENFTGQDILSACKLAGMQLGEFNIRKNILPCKVFTRFW